MFVTVQIVLISLWLAGWGVTWAEEGQYNFSRDRLLWGGGVHGVSVHCNGQITAHSTSCLGTSEAPCPWIGRTLPHCWGLSPQYLLLVWEVAQSGC